MGAYDHRVWETLSEMYRNGELEGLTIPGTDIIIEGNCARYKGYGFCVNIELLIREHLINTSYPADLRGKKIRWPTKKNRLKQQLLLLLLADMYPAPASVAELRERAGKIIENPVIIRVALHRYYYYYGIAERVGHGLYRMRRDFYEALSSFMPGWRAYLYCLLSSYDEEEHSKVENSESQTKHKNVSCELLYNILVSFLASIAVERMQGYRRLQKVAHGYRRLHLVATRETVSYDNNIIEKIRELIREKKPALYEQLSGDIQLASELTAVLYARAKEGRTYITGTNRDELHTALADEARRVLGSGSSLCRVLDWDRIASLISLLRSANIVYTARYGREYKIRIDKHFMKLLEEYIEGRPA